jgi:rhodanese-related sulfurtransferase
MLRSLVLAVVFCLSLSGMSIAEEAKTPAEKFKQHVMMVSKKINTIDSLTLNGWIDDAEKDFILLDVREPKEVSAAKIEADNYMAIPRGVLEMQFIRKVNDLNTPIVVYCLKGSRGALATEALSQLGYTNVHNLKGGFLAWVEAGYPVSNFLGEFELQNFESNFNKGS